MNKKRVLLLLSALVATPLTLPVQNQRVDEWAKLFYVDAKLDQNYLNGIASFICYMLERQPSEKCFNKELKRVKKAFNGSPHYFQQSLVRLFSNSFKTYVTSKPAELNEDTWQSSLAEYYHSVYPLLDTQHRTINYGPKKGAELPTFK